VTHPERISSEVADADLIRAIDGASGEPRTPRVIDLQRHPFEYATSATLERITTVMNDGSVQRFVLKHLGQISEKARRAKPAFVLDPQREIEVYRRLLAPVRIGPRLIGSSIAPQIGSYWLLIEHVDGRPLYEVGELDGWTATARWLASMHTRFATLDHQGALQHDARLISYNRGWYALWLDRARRFFSFEGPVNSKRTSTSLRWLADRYDKVLDHMLSLPTTLIHGEFYSSNVLVGSAPADAAVCPIDWEMAAIGPAVIDLAALTSGHWSDEDRRAMVAGYVGASDDSDGGVLDTTVESVAYAQIHLAVQWLGWFGRRQAAVEHARDWLSDAVDRAEALRL
jgi:aminoglycoside phosphotransferase (APT) family kinase protein